MVDPTGRLTDCGLPEEGTDGHLTLLFAGYLAARLRAEPATEITMDALASKAREFIQEHKKHWRKNVTEPGQDRALTHMVVHRLVALGLARKMNQRVKPLPAIGRYGLREPNIDPESRDRAADSRQDAFVF